MDKRIQATLEGIRHWDQKLQTDFASYKRELSSAKNFVTDETLGHWTYCKSVGLDGNYHTNGKEARLALESLGFLDVLNTDLPSEFKEQVLAGFDTWRSVFAKRLDRPYKSNLNELRIYIPPLSVFRREK